MAPSRPGPRLAMLALGLAALASSLLVGPSVPTSAVDLGAHADASACVPSSDATAMEGDGLIPVQPLAQGNVFDHGPPRSILIVTARPDPIAPVIDPASAPVVEAVDFSANVLIGLFIGRWPQVGHQVTIQSVRVTDGGVCLTALVTGPAPGQDAADAETYPYEVVTVPLAAIPQVPGTRWTAVSPDGTIIGSATFP